MAEQEQPYDIDYESAFTMYQARFAEKFGEKPDGSFVKFGKHMTKKLSSDEFPRRLDAYVSLHQACKRMLDGGATISDALVLDFEEAAAWVSVQAPNILAMFKGEIGDSRKAAPARGPVTKQVESPDGPPKKRGSMPPPPKT